VLDIFDLLLAPFYIGFILILANFIRRKRIGVAGKEYFRYLLPALMCKIIGAVSLCLIYTFYYEDGGDVTNYFISTRTYVNVLLEGHFEKFFTMLDYKDNNVHAVLASGNVYGYFMFNPHDYYALFTIMLTIPLCLLGLKSFIATAVLLATVSFIGIWKLYEVFVDQFPQLSKQFAITCFFIPSVFFWGSGILKDTYTFSAIGFFVFGVYRFQIQKVRQAKYLIMIIAAACVFIFIKPYILFALLPGTLLWVFFNRITNIKNAFFRLATVPFILLMLFVIVVTVFQGMAEYLGEYSLDNILRKAVKTQQDLIRTAYGTSSYDIGKFDATIGGVLQKVPAALNLALFRPYIWDARNPVMLLSALENLFMLGFSLYMLFKVRFTVLLSSLQSHPLLIFSFLFALVFAFSVGLTTANYGALARLKIPCIPFYVASLFILYELNKKSFRRR
jgi:hypothetical protein